MTNQVREGQTKAHTGSFARSLVSGEDDLAVRLRGRLPDSRPHKLRRWSDKPKGGRLHGAEKNSGKLVKI